MHPSEPGSLQDDKGEEQENDHSVNEQAPLRPRTHTRSLLDSIRSSPRSLCLLRNTNPSGSSAPPTRQSQRLASPSDHGEIVTLESRALVSCLSPGGQSRRQCPGRNGDTRKVATTQGAARTEKTGAWHTAESAVKAGEKLAKDHRTGNGYEDKSGNEGASGTEDESRYKQDPDADGGGAGWPTVLSAESTPADASRSQLHPKQEASQNAELQSREIRDEQRFEKRGTKH
ncbi:uncharacterized protein MYCGRDRAFT_97870 [Zymoseptoria tritici IPO323]|uniref:Uncharacterized protein n=1 Tax=Zymoseptoria tritici (strain CBS 115943 / IPO323) TaxID=336722 RepID=F9XRM6_ZYMTI|nr:uncharacterized protein MYCGRDRAFT_97870 [Zymoseptoria tritici IPO323]EGP82060.1 hypothetical protein MYCGRDRAFT_97870 [Zymoseptoria tritici IPO323]